MLSTVEVLAIVGCGLGWIGLQIVWVAPLPRQLRKGDVPTAPPGSQAAFSLFWIDQYGWLGLALTLLGVGLVATAWGLS